MRNFSHEKILVRKTEDLTIVFYDDRTIYIQDKYNLVVCQRWFVQKSGYYSEAFKPFVDRLKRTKQLNMQYVKNLAESFEIDIRPARSLPRINRRVEFINSAGRIRNKKDVDDLIVKEIIFGRKR